MEKLISAHLSVETWVMMFFICIIIAGFIMYMVFSWMFSNKKDALRKQLKDEPRQMIIPTRSFIDISVDPSGTFDDTLASVKTQIGYIISNLNTDGSLKLLIMASAFDGLVSHHLIHLLRELSRTTARIDFLEDIERSNIAQVINSIKGHGVRIDNIYLITDSIIISELATYDIIMSAHSGVRSTYELIHGVIHELAMKER